MQRKARPWGAKAETLVVNFNPKDASLEAVPGVRRVTSWRPWHTVDARTGHNHNGFHSAGFTDGVGENQCWSAIYLQTTWCARKDDYPDYQLVHTSDGLHTLDAAKTVAKYWTMSYVARAVFDGPWKGWMNPGAPTEVAISALGLGNLVEIPHVLRTEEAPKVTISRLHEELNKKIFRATPDVRPVSKLRSLIRREVDAWRPWEAEDPVLGVAYRGFISVGYEEKALGGRRWWWAVYAHSNSSEVGTDIYGLWAAGEGLHEEEKAWEAVEAWMANHVAGLKFMDVWCSIFFKGTPQAAKISLGLGTPVSMPEVLRPAPEWEARRRQIHQAYARAVLNRPRGPRVLHVLDHVSGLLKSIIYRLAYTGYEDGSIRESHRALHLELHTLRDFVNEMRQEFAAHRGDRP